MIAWLNKYVLGAAVPSMLVIFGIYFGFKLGWFHVLHPLRTVRIALSGDKKKAFSALTLALAGTLGVGNIVGVAAALVGGGCGAIFWMWVSAFFAMILKYSEIVLAMRHRRYDEKENVHGSAMYYIRDRFFSRGYKRSGRLLSGVFALFFILNALTMGSLIQVGAVTDAFFFSFSMPKVLTAAILACLTLWVMLGGRGSAMKLTEKIVPLMTLGVVVLSLAVLLVKMRDIPAAVARIFSEAFDLRALGGGVFGFLLSDAIRLGTMRGLISNEAGCGTSPTAHAESDNTRPSVQGIWGIFEVFVDTILLCTVTALVIIVSGVPLSADSFMELTISAYSSVLGEWSSYPLAAAVFCFGFATVVCWSHYGREGVYYLSKKPFYEKAFCVIYTVSVLLGGLISSEAPWQLADLAIGAMTVINLLVLFWCRREISEESRLLRSRT